MAKYFENIDQKLEVCLIQISKPIRVHKTKHNQQTKINLQKILISINLK